MPEGFIFLHLYKHWRFDIFIMVISFRRCFWRDYFVWFQFRDDLKSSLNTSVIPEPTIYKQTYTERTDETKIFSWFDMFHRFLKCLSIIWKNVVVFFVAFINVIHLTPHQTEISKIVCFSSKKNRQNPPMKWESKMCRKSASHLEVSHL